MRTNRSSARSLAVWLVVTAAACAPETGSAPEDLADFGARYTAAWNSQDAAAVAAFFAEDGALKINDGDPSVGRSEIAAAAQGFMTDFPDMVITMDSLGRSGDRVTYHWTFDGTNTGPGGTGSSVHFSGHEEWRFGSDGLIADSRGHFDEAEYERQLAAGGPGLPTWEFDPSMIFPTDGSLTRPEDGVALPGGRLIVGDQAHGLRMVEPDGSSAPFGDMVAAGYVHRPPEHSGGANGVSLEPDGTHVLVADIFHGGIYRVEVATGATERIYQHRYGVNTAVRDSRGTIWFTQSAHNTPEEGEARMWVTVDVPVPEGAVLRLGMQDGRPAGEAEVVVDSLYFGNGIVIDEAAGDLYVSETLGGRVLRFRVDLDTGLVSEREVFVDGVEPDNLELDGEGHLWVALPLTNSLLAVDTETGERHTAFRSLTPEQAEVIEEFFRRGESGMPRMELFTPAMWAPLPGLATGLIISPDGGPIYLTGLGNALVKLNR